jgi:tRNA nucleotidyltransferase (CCA-adding enzyme)
MSKDDTSRLRRQILRNKFCRQVFALDNEVFVVGGYLRDLLIKDTHSKDIDFSVKRNVRRLVNEVASALGGRVVELRRERMLRVAVRSEVTLDFSKMNGNIEDDLGGRDFTLNAMAWSPSTGLIDPYRGLRDLRKGVVKVIKKSNLRDDPVRLLRAYRHAAELNIALNADTRRLIRPLARNLRKSARERITLELFKLLNAENAVRYLNMALKDGLLEQIIPLNNNNLRSNLKLASSLAVDVKKSHERLFFKEFSQGLSRLGLLRLELIMLGANLNESLLAVSSDIRKRIQATGSLYREAINHNKSSSSELFDLFRDAGDSAEDLMLITNHASLLPELRRFMRIDSKGLLDSREIMEIAGIRGGPRLGRIIMEMKRLQFAGRVRTKEAAKRWISMHESYQH